MHGKQDGPQVIDNFIGTIGLSGDLRVEPDEGLPQALTTCRPMSRGRPNLCDTRQMQTTTSLPYKGFRYPQEIISH
ncbi:MAG: hypothetical protein M3R24_12060, partial [Chloroflexota bacterium]|nr:hypothetical protein [Chloroflexota bacterium]